MARYSFHGRTRDVYGNIIPSTSISIYVATTTTAAIVYTEYSGGTGISSAPQITSDSNGYFSFFVDDTDYDASTLFDITSSTITYEYIDIFRRGPAGGTDIILDTSPQLGGDLDTNDFSVIYSTTLSTDHSYNGDMVVEEVGETVTFPQLLYYDLSEEKWKLCDASQIGTMPGEGIALESKSSGETCKILTRGRVRDDSWSWTVDDSVKILYPSTTPGSLSQTAVSNTGNCSQAVATIRDTNIINFNPSLSLVVLR